MADVMWPASIPLKILRGFNEQPLEELRSFQPDMPGPALTERIAVSDMTEISFQVLMSLADFAIFKSFWSNDLAGGANRLLVDHPESHTPIRIYFAGRYGVQIQPPTHRIVTISGIAEIL